MRLGGGGPGEGRVVGRQTRLLEVNERLCPNSRSDTGGTGRLNEETSPVMLVQELLALTWLLKGQTDDAHLALDGADLGESDGDVGEALAELLVHLLLQLPRVHVVHDRCLQPNRYSN